MRATCRRRGVALVVEAALRQSAAAGEKRYSGVGAARGWRGGGVGRREGGVEAAWRRRGEAWRRRGG